MIGLIVRHKFLIKPVISNCHFSEGNPIAEMARKEGKRKVEDERLEGLKNTIDHKTASITQPAGTSEPFHGIPTRPQTPQESISDNPSQASVASLKQEQLMIRRKA